RRIGPQRTDAIDLCRWCRLDGSWLTTASDSVDTAAVERPRDPFFASNVAAQELSATSLARSRTIKFDDSVSEQMAEIRIHTLKMNDRIRRCPAVLAELLNM